MIPWTFSIKFSYDTQFIFKSLLFTVREDESLELLTRGPPPRHLAPVYGQPPYLLANPYTSSGACSCLNPYAGLYYLSTKTSQGRPIKKLYSILQLEHLFPHRQGQFLIRIPSKTNLKLRAVLAGTLPSRLAASTWWA
jgi:hypothetical protein